MKLLPKILIAAAMLFASAGLLYDATNNGSADAANIDTSRDCDQYAVMYCGSMTKKEILKKLNDGDGQHSASNIKDIYSKFNLTAKKIENAKFQEGVVYKNGNVKIGDRVVATNAKTYIRTMGKVSTSNMGSAQAALVAVDSNGKFLFAIMTPCGNPVVADAVEPPKESIKCESLTVAILNNDQKTVEAKVAGSAKNTKISGYKIDFGDGKTVNKKTAQHTYSNYGKYTIVAHVTGEVNGKQVSDTGQACKKEVTFTQPVKPLVQSITCDLLSVNILDQKAKEVEAKVVGSAQNTTISAYKINFGDGTVVNQQTAKHTFGDYGKYKIVAHVTGTVDGQQKTVSGPACEKEVVFNKPPEPQVQSLTCDTLTLSLYNKEKKYIKVELKGSASNTKIDEYKIDFGDGKTADQATAEHTYADYGKYTIKGYVSGMLDGKKVTVGGDGGCVQTVEFKEDIKPCPTNPALPVDSPKCKPCPSNPALNYDSPDCKEPVAPELPNTGAGAIVGLFSGVSILGAVGHRIWFSRKIG